MYVHIEVTLIAGFQAVFGLFLLSMAVFMDFAEARWKLIGASVYP
jgi:hypothetical protein